MLKLKKRFCSLIQTKEVAELKKFDVPLRRPATTWCRQVADQRRLQMKTLIMALVALSVVTGTAPVANALDAKSFYEQQDRSSH